QKGFLTDGRNTLRFRFNGTDGVSVGYRVLAFNFVTATGRPLLPPETFTQDDPDTWRPPLSDPLDAAIGRRLWYSAPLKLSPLQQKTTITAHCMDCHTQDGRDLKYFNYSNLSIIERAKFHGLTQRQAEQIASYIRSLNLPHPGRPWNPPYQPGPGLDSKPLSDWAAGAGIGAVLDKDSDMLPYLFPKGIAAEAIATDKTLDVRELPIAFQLLDWNHWLPREFPRDAWGNIFLRSRFFQDYSALRLASKDFTNRIGMGSFFTDMQRWREDRRQFLGAYTRSDSTWTPETSEQIYSAARWQMVKTFEMMQEFHLEDHGPGFFGPTAEARTWEVGHAFYTAPGTLSIPADSRGVEGDSLLMAYHDNAWTWLQLILDAGNRRQTGADLMDWSAAYSDFRTLAARAPGTAGALRMVAFLVKEMQNRDNGIGPDKPDAGWNPAVSADVSLLADPAYDLLWTGVRPSDRAAILQATLQDWLAKCRQYTPQQYAASGLREGRGKREEGREDPMPEATSWAARIWTMIPRYRRLGVDPELLGSVCDWAKTLWPQADWASLLNHG
ncbi:MAG TPA: hypothetical protein VKT32_02975, partial [Chthonomonadaceae bacterium]|nr:hypothetical protein [Chthonomonadaceae bacterium]